MLARGISGNIGWVPASDADLAQCTLFHGKRTQSEQATWKWIGSGALREHARAGRPVTSERQRTHQVASQSRDNWSCRNVRIPAARPDKNPRRSPQCCRRHPSGRVTGTAPHTKIRPESHQGGRRAAVAVGQNPAEMKIEEFSASRQFSFTFGLAKIGCEQHRPTLPTRDHGIRRKSLDTAKTALCGIEATRSATYWTQQMVSIPIKAAYVILSQYRHQIIRNQQSIAQNLLSK